MAKIGIEASQAFNCISWLLQNKIVNENGSPIEFEDHPFLIDPYLDNTEVQSIKKCSQIGWSTLSILRSMHLARFAGANIIHTFPSRSIARDFVSPKVDPLIEKNPVIKKMIGLDSRYLKQVGDRFIYYRGTWEQQEAISISAHILINDEYDRCLLPDTEVLTKDGWKKIQEITLDDKVAVRHPVHHNVSFKSPKEVISLDYDGDVYRFIGRSLDLRVTKNHRMFVRKSGAFENWGLHSAKSIYGKSFVMTGHARWLSDFEGDKVAIPYVATRRNTANNGVQDLFYKKREVDAKYWYQFLGWYLSEGCVVKGRNSRNFKKANGSIDITQKDKKVIDEIAFIIKKLGFEPRIYQQKNGIYHVQFTSLHLALYLQKLGSSHTKYIPKRWLFGKPEWCKYMLETLLKGDGDERNVYSTISKRLADGVQILALRCGKSASIYRSGKMYKVGILERRYRRFNGYRDSNGKATVKKEKYKGKVYCLSVPQETFMIRTPLPIWTGNSNPKVLKTYKSRLDDAKRENPKLGWEWRFSNPTIPGYGVDELWQESDQKHWFVKCRHCNYEWYLKFPDNIDFNRKRRMCAKCHKEIGKEELRSGRWVKKYSDRDISGYWISQMFVPWITAAKIIKDSEGDEEVFHNFTLGLPFISKETGLTRQAIIEALSPGWNKRGDVAMGVDNGIEKHYVIGNRAGIFEYGKTKDWKDIENLRNKYQAYMVIDANPYPNTPMNLAAKYPGKVYIHYYQRDTQGMGVVRWDHDAGVVKSDRTKIIDAFVSEVNNKDITFNLTGTQLEEYIYHCEQTYRTIDVSKRGIQRPVWKTIEGKPDHYLHASIYWRVALEQTMGEGGILGFDLIDKGKKGMIVDPDQTEPALDLKRVLEKANEPKPQSWKSI